MQRSKSFAHVRTTFPWRKPQPVRMSSSEDTKASEKPQGEDVDMKDEEKPEEGETEKKKDPKAAQRDKDLLTFEGRYIYRHQEQTRIELLNK